MVLARRPSEMKKGFLLKAAPTGPEQTGTAVNSSASTMHEVASMDVDAGAAQDQDELMQQGAREGPEQTGTDPKSSAARSSAQEAGTAQLAEIARREHAPLYNIARREYLHNRPRIGRVLAAPAEVKKLPGCLSVEEIASIEDELMRAAALYLERFAQADGTVPATFQVIYLHGWSPHASQRPALAPGSATARLASALETEERSAGDVARPVRRPGKKEH